MKILEKQFFGCKSGTVKIVPEEPDDLWLAYNLIAVGDIITTHTTRKVQLSSSGDASSSKSKTPSTRIKINLEITVTAIDNYGNDSTSLRVRGKNRVASDHFNAGTFHSLDLEKGKEFTLEKKVWDPQSIESLEKSSSGGSNLGIVLMELGLGQIFLVGKNGTKRFAKIEQNPNPKTGPNKFFESVFSAFKEHIDLNTISCVVIGSPGTIKDDFRNYILSPKLKSIENNKSSIVLVKTSSGKETSLNEILQDKKVMSFIKDNPITMEIKAMKELNDMISSNSDRCCYGLKSVEAAHELSAIKTLMITDDLFRSKEVVMRKKCCELVESVKRAGGKAMVFSATNVSGEELAKLTGIAAVLRFPVPELDELAI